MGLEFSSFASGSSGNCYMVRSEGTVLLVDVGIAGKHVIAGLREHGHEPEHVDGILITHEHTDHIKSIRMIGRKAVNAVVYGSHGTLAEIDELLPAGRAMRIVPDEDFAVGDIEVRAFDLCHDAAEPTGFSIRSGGRQVTVVTDTGCITEKIFGEMLKADLLVLEANHEVAILRMSSYTFELKQRILGDTGHLSNEAAGKLLCELLKQRKTEKIPKILLAHISNENNTPEHARMTINNILFEEDFMDGRDYELSVIPRSEVSAMIKV